MEVSIKGVSIKFDGAETKDAIAFINALQEEEREKTADAQEKELLRANKGAELNSSQYEVWSFLMDHDNENGVPVAGMARALSSTSGAISHRLTILASRGYAKRVHRGYYRYLMP